VRVPSAFGLVPGAEGLLRCNGGDGQRTRLAEGLFLAVAWGNRQRRLHPRTFPRSRHVSISIDRLNHANNVLRILRQDPDNALVVHVGKRWLEEFAWFHQAVLHEVIDDPVGADNEVVRVHLRYDLLKLFLIVVLQMHHIIGLVAVVLLVQVLHETQASLEVLRPDRLTAADAMQEFGLDSTSSDLAD